MEHGTRIYVETDGVLALRPMTPEDSQLIVDWRNNPRVQMRYIYREPFTLEGQQQYYRRRVATGEVAQFIACEITSGRSSSGEGPGKAAQESAGGAGPVTVRPVGCVVLDDIHPQYAECGNWIGEDDAVGRGYSPRMIRLACRWAFRELGLSDIVARIFTDNPASIRSYERAGFQAAGVLPEVECSDGTRKDMYLLRLQKGTASGY